MTVNSLTAALPPEELVGIWRRESLLLVGVEGVPEVPFETADVCWFQARTRYADLRVPRAADAGPFSTVEAFGGRQSWSAPRLRFHHELDRSGGFADDEGTLAWDGETLVETGEFVSAGVSCRFTERWVRTTPQGVRAEVWERRGGEQALSGLVLRIADQQLALILTGGEVCAERRVQEPGGFRVLARLGSAPYLDRVLAPDWHCIEGAG